jgi:hypothetical protein
LGGQLLVNAFDGPHSRPADHGRDDGSLPALQESRSAFLGSFFSFGIELR